MSKILLFEWHKRFTEGRWDVEGNSRSGKLSTSRTDDNVEHVRRKCSTIAVFTIKMIADELGMNSERMCRTIKKDLSKNGNKVAE